MHFKNNKIILFLRYLIAFGIVTVLVIHVRNQYNIISILEGFNFQILLPVLLILTLHLFFLFIAWRLIIIKIGCIKPEEHRIVHSFLGGRALGLITPAQSGELLKGLFFSAESRNVVTSLSLIYAAYELFVRTILGCISLAYLSHRELLLYDLNKYFVIMLTIFFVLVLIIVLLLRKTNIINVLLSYMPNRLIELYTILKYQLRTTSVLWFISISILILIANSLAACSFMLILSGFNINIINMDGFMIYLISYMIMSLVSITPSGLGINEGARLYFFSLLGCNQGAILCSSLIMFGMNIVFPAIIGIWSLKYFLQKAKV